MRSNSLAERDIASVLHPYTNLKKHREVGPTVLTRGEGIYLYDSNGTQYLDGAAGQWCAALGYSYDGDRLPRVAYEAMKNLPYAHIFRGQSNPITIEFSEKLLELAPVPMSKVMLQSSGSEANDSAVKMAWYYWHSVGQPQRRKIISRMGSYHGSTCASLSLTGNVDYYRGFGLPLDGFLKVSGLNHYREGLPGETEEQFSQRLADELEQTILTEGPETIAAFWADPVQGNAGALPPPVGYFEKVQRILRKFDILFVVDEVICGFGRTGEWWGTNRYDLQPDIITSAKALSAALQPLSAVMINERVYQALADESDRLGSFIHGFTYAGHPVACAVALEVLRIYEEIDIAARVKAIEPKFQDVLQQFANRGIVGNVSGVGLLGGLELVADRETRARFPKAAGLAPRVEAAARKHGLMVRVIADRLVFAPPLIISEQELDLLADKAHRALAEIV